VTLVCDHKRNGKARPSEEPLPTQTTKARSSMVTLVLGQHGAAACRPTSKPVPTVACKGAVRLIEPIVIDNANGGVIRGSNEPINTITLKDQHMMALPVLEDGRRIDILMRMLTPRELARAHSVPDDFVITGNKTEQTKQIGNSVPVRTARALVGTLLKRYVKKGARDA
jgi:DNA (cytosine-5)-methyltransferase 1